MSQQTTMACVVPKFERFIAELPTCADLAACSDEKLRELWAGLGYYARARNLKKTAQKIVTERKGRFPSSYQEWLEMPGCGPYTASVIASVANNEPVACVDGNVIRVVSRLLAMSEDVWTPHGQEKIQKYVSQHVSRERPGDFNQAMMELGATVCSKQSPKCGSCPIKRDCQAFAENRVEECPPTKPRKAAVDVTLCSVIVTDQKTKQVALLHRTEGFLAGTVGFPLLEHSQLEKWVSVFSRQDIPPGAWRHIPSAYRHSITHHKISGQVVLLEKSLLTSASSKDLLGVHTQLKWIDACSVERGLATSLDKKALAAVLRQKEPLFSSLPPSR